MDVSRLAYNKTHTADGMGVRGIIGGSNCLYPLKMPRRYLPPQIKRNKMDKKVGFSKKIENPEVAAVFKSYPQKIRVKLMFLRQLILEAAASFKIVGSFQSI